MFVWQRLRVAGPVDKLYRAKGCAKCKHVGYSGRIGIYELFVPDDATIDKISSGATLNDLRQATTTANMRTLRVDGIDKVKLGVTTMEEIYRVTA